MTAYGQEDEQEAADPEYAVVIPTLGRTGLVPLAASTSPRSASRTVQILPCILGL